MSALLTVAAIAAELGVRPRWVTERIAAGELRAIHAVGRDERPAEDRRNERTEGGALDACADIALGGGAFASLDRRGSAPADDSNARFERKKCGPFTAELDGFNVQAAVRIEADDDEGRELDFFHAERISTGSHLKIQASLKFTNCD